MPTPTGAANEEVVDASGVVDRAIHLTGIAAASVGVPVLIGHAALRADRWILASTSLYGIALLTTLTCSLLYNSAPVSLRKEQLRRVDHAVIFAMIAATCTPFALCKIGGDQGYLLAAGIWAVALCGVALKLQFPRCFERVGLTLYLALGWVALAGFARSHAAFSFFAILLAVAGGIIYTAGAYVLVSARLRYHTAIWHGCVMAASTCFYAAMFRDVVLL